MMKSLSKALKVILVFGSVMSMTIAAQAEGYRAKASSYYPSNSQMEGGHNDRLGRRLYTLQQFLAGKAPYVSVAMDSTAFKYGQKLQIPEIDKHYGKQIEFRVVDTGGRFKGRGKKRIDICTQNQRTSIHPLVNGMVTLIPMN